MVILVQSNLVGGLVAIRHIFPRNIGFLVIPIDGPYIFQRGGPTTNR